MKKIVQKTEFNFVPADSYSRDGEKEDESIEEEDGHPDNFIEEYFDDFQNIMKEAFMSLGKQT